MMPTRPHAARRPGCTAGKDSTASPWPDKASRAWASRWSLLLLVGALALLAWTGRALAGTVPGDLPGTVGRLSVVQGDVQWYDADSAQWLGSAQQPLRNWPVAAGDRVRTGPDARAELQVGSTTLRLGADVDLALQQLDDNGLLLRLQSGTLALRLARPAAGDGATVEVATPEGRWLPQAPGHYRLERQPEARTPATQATVWRGELRFEGPDSALLIPAGRRADLWQDRGRGGATRYAWAAVERDAFADWVARDERSDDAPVTARHVPPGMSGWQDLDRHGDWLDSPEHGSLWQPRGVASGWAPFQDGRWAWVAPWGWTWIDAAPWGFAPFHYGSWVMFSGRWSWSPGPRHLRPRFAPVHRAWVGGPQLSVGIQIGGGHRPPPPRVVMPVLPRPVVVAPVPPRPVVALPPPAGHGHRPPHAAPPPPPLPRAGDRPDGRHHRDDRDLHRPDGDRQRPDRQHGAERVDRGPAPVPQVAAPLPAPARPGPPKAEPRVDIADRPARPERLERAERGDRADHADRLDRSDRPDRSDNAVRRQRQDSPNWR